MADQTTQLITVTIDEAEQEELWKEVGEMAIDVAWGKYCWEFADECRAEYYLVRKRRETESTDNVLNG